MALREREQKTYAIIIADGSIRLKADESDPKAVKRTIELKDGTSMTKIERVYHELSGYITAIEFKDGDYGKTCNVGITDGYDVITLSLSLSQPFGEDFLKKLPSINLKKEVVLRPFSFEDDKKKLRKGISVIQEGAGADGKVKNFFSDPDTKKNLHGFPEVPKPYNEMDSDDWKIYFMTTRKFLQKFVEENIIPMLDTSFDIETAVKIDDMPVIDTPVEEQVGDNPFGDQ